MLQGLKAVRIQDVGFGTFKDLLGDNVVAILVQHRGQRHARVGGQRCDGRPVLRLHVGRQRRRQDIPRQ